MSQPQQGRSQGAHSCLGRTGLIVSRLGLGGAGLGGVYGALASDDDAQRTVEAAVALGITFIDTAPLYGMGLSEERIGRALARCRGRHRVVLATKIGYLPPGIGYDRATTVAAVEASLTRLRTDYVDLIQVHEADRVSLPQLLGETLEGLRLLQASGKIRYFGITGEEVTLLSELADSGLFDTIQTFRHYMLTDQTAACRLIPTALQHSMGVINGAPLGSGLLADNTPQPMPTSHKSDLALRVGILRHVAKHHGMSLPEMAIRYSLSHTGISTTIPGARSVEEIRRDACAWQAGPLSPEIIAAIGKINHTHNTLAALRHWRRRWGTSSTR